MSASVVIYLKLEKTFSSKIVLRSPSENDFFTMMVLNNSNIQFVNEFTNMMKSKDNIENYLKKNNLSDLVNQISITTKLSQNKELKEIGKKNKQKYYIGNLVFFIEYPEHVDGEFILSDYTKETQSLAVKIFVNKKKKYYQNMIKQHNRALDIATEIEMTEPQPLVKSLVVRNLVISEPTALFYKGTKVLKQKIYHLEEDLNYISNSEFDFKIILDRPSDGSVTNNHLYKYLLKGLLFGILLTLLIIPIFRMKKNSSN
ncbi:hypothetical protein [Candidatus Pelagibacter bacterium nBUS_29]|uniref:hypothetical protein n=1 Tax=Candidatus Pelagibacter bacterium nBUS_29 TaxID=3374190 RepID=UPI003EBE75E5